MFLTGKGTGGNHARWSSEGHGCEFTGKMLPPLRDREYAAPLSGPAADGEGSAGILRGRGRSRGSQEPECLRGQDAMVTLTGEKKRHNDWGRTEQQWASQTRRSDEAEGCRRRGPKGSGQRSGCEVWPGSGGPPGGA